MDRCVDALLVVFMSFVNKESDDENKMVVTWLKRYKTCNKTKPNSVYVCVQPAHTEQTIKYLKHP